MSSDAAYRARYLAAARTLWDCSKGNPQDIPGDYTEHLSHSYIDGDISLVSTIDRFECAGGLEPEEWDEAVELLSKVSEDDWPFIEDITSVNAEELLRIYDKDASDFDFAETPGTTSEKAELVLRHAIESVFGDIVQKVRSTSGKFPDEGNQYLQQPDGSYKGSFEYDGNKFDFQLEPDEMGWTLQYRMTASSLDKLPPISDMGGQVDESSRNRGWK
jgi:hypothetical protein